MKLVLNVVRLYFLGSEEEETLLDAQDILNVTTPEIFQVKIQMSQKLFSMTLN